MELPIALALSILNAVMCVLNFAFGRKDKAIKDTKEEVEKLADEKLIKHRLDEVDKKLNRIIDILDGYDKEIDERVEKAIENHIAIYHK